MTDFVIRVIVDPSGARRGISEVERGLDRVETAGSRVGSALGKAFGGLVATGALVQIAQLSETYNKLQNRLRTVTTGQAQLADVTEKLFGIANRSRQSFESTAELYARVANSAKDLGLSQSELLSFTESLNQAVALSGASAVEAEAGLMQLSQGLASGALRGDELRSVLEQLPAVADVIAKSLGVTRGELRELGADGAITADVVLKAFKDARVELADNFAKSVPTVGQAFTVLKNNILESIGSLDQAVGASAAVSKAVLFLADNMELLAVAAALAGGALVASFSAAAIASVVGGLASMARTITLMIALLGPLGAASVVASSALTALGTAAAALAAPLAAAAAAGASLGILYRIYTQESRAAESATQGYADMVGILDEALKGLDTTTDTGIAKAKEITLAHYNAALAVQERVKAEAQLALQQADAAMNDYNPFNDVTTYIALDDVYNRLVQANSAVEAMKERMAEFGLTTNAAGQAVSIMTGEVAKTAEQVRQAHAEQLAFYAADRARSAEATAEANAILAQYQRQAELQRLILQYGADSVQVKRFEVDAQVAVVQKQLESLDVAQSVKDEILRTVRNAETLSRIDMSTPLRKALGVAQLLTAEIGRAIAAALRANSLVVAALSAARNTVVGQAAESFVEKGVKAVGSLFSGVQQEVEARGGLGSIFNGFVEQAKAAEEAKLGSGGVGSGGGSGGGGAVDTEAVTAQNAALEAQKRLLEEIQGPQLNLELRQQALTALYDQGKIGLEEYTAKLRDLRVEATALDNTLSGGLANGLARIAQQANNLGQQMSNFVVDAFNKATDAIVNFAKTGQLNVRQFFQDLFAQLLKLALNQLFAKLIGGLFPGLGGIGGGGGGGGGLGGLLGFATGGSFTVGGSGGTDSQLVAFKATPGEQVDISTRAQQRAGTLGGNAPTGGGTTVVPAPKVNVAVVLSEEDVVGAFSGEAGDISIVRAVERNASTVAKITGGAG